MVKFKNRKREYIRCTCDCGHIYFLGSHMFRVRPKITEERKIICGGCLHNVENATDVYRFFHSQEVV